MSTAFGLAMSDGKAFSDYLDKLRGDTNGKKSGNMELTVERWW